MKNKLFYFILSVVFTTLISCDPITYDTFGTISGTVVEMSTGDVVEGALVTLSPTGKNTYTGSDGFFEIQNLEAQQYTLTVQATGYSTNRKTVTVVAGSVERVNIVLERKD